METSVQFPELGLSFDISRVAFTIFGIDIYWYGLLIGLGMILAVAFAFTQAKSFGVDADYMVDVIICGFILGIIGARLYFVIFTDIHYETLWDMVNLRDGGLAFYGGLIGAVAGALIGCRWRKVPILPMLDLTAMGFLIGSAFGRWGNFFNQEAFGSNTTGLFGMISPATTQYLTLNQPRLISQGIFVDPSMPVHPTFLYESLWCALGFVLLFAYRKHRRFNGEILLMYVMWYGAARFVLEGLRTDSLMSFGSSFRVSQVLAFCSALGAFAVWAYIRVKRKNQPLVVPQIPPHTAKVKLPTIKGEQEITISWPAEEKAPNHEEKLRLAQQIWDASCGEEGEEPQPKEESAPKAAPGKKQEAADADAAPTDDDAGARAQQPEENDEAEKES